jgi:hypothetical protein
VSTALKFKGCRVAKQPVAPVHVRLPPETLEHLRRFAANRKQTVHAEVVRAVEELLAREGGADPVVTALRVATNSLIDRFAWMASSPDEAPEDERRLLLNLVRSGLDTLMSALGAEAEPSPEVRSMGGQAARHVMTEMQRQADTPLGEAGRALSVEKRP